MITRSWKSFLLSTHLQFKKLNKSLKKLNKMESKLNSKDNAKKRRLLLKRKRRRRLEDKRNSKKSKKDGRGNIKKTKIDWSGRLACNGKMMTERLRLFEKRRTEN